MTRAFDNQQLSFCWNQLARCLNLLDRAEGIACALHKKRGHMKLMNPVAILRVDLLSICTQIGWTLLRV